MRKLFLTSLLVLFGCVLFAQKGKLTVTYYDAQWKKTGSRAKASYYREAYKENDTLYVSDYYINGNKRMIGQFSDLKGQVKDGLFRYYNEAGTRESEGKYINNKREGIWTYWFPEGKLERNGEYINDKREGEWLVYDLDGMIRQRWIYGGDTIVKVKEFNKNGVELNENDTFTIVDQMPKFSEEPEALMTFLQRKLQYPSRARENNIQGRIVIQFLVDKNGVLKDLQVIKSDDPDLAEEALRVIKLMPDWIPGKQSGKVVCVRYTLPIIFKLS